MRISLPSAAALLLGIGLHVAPATAQTTPARTRPPARDTSAHNGLSEKPPLVDTQGQYVGPGMTGAPKQQVLTDYDNNVIPSAAKALKKEGEQTSLSSQPEDKVKAKRLKTRRPPKRD